MYCKSIGYTVLCTYSVYRSIGTPESNSLDKLWPRVHLGLACFSRVTLSYCNCNLSCGLEVSRTLRRWTPSSSSETPFPCLYCLTVLWVLGSYTDRQLLQYTIHTADRAVIQTGKSSLNWWGRWGAWASIRIYLLWCTLCTTVYGPILQDISWYGTFWYRWDLLWYGTFRSS